MGATWSQLFPPTPQFTEKALLSLKDKVFLITGGASGVGFQLATILYHAGGTVYIAGRSEANANKAIQEIKSVASDVSSVGTLHFMFLDLEDLATIKPAANQFKKHEAKLHVLWNNAGVSMPPLGSISKQGHELQMATNCLGPLLLARLLTPCLQAVAEDSKGVGRVVWTSSLVVDTSAPIGGIDLAQVKSPPADQTQNYATSKTGNWFLASEFGRQEANIISVTQNPGNLKTNVLRHAPSLTKILSYPLLYNAKFGAYTELYAGLSPELDDVNKSGSYIIPWGRSHPSPRKDLLDALESEESGGTGQAREFMVWCDAQIADYL